MKYELFLQGFLQQFSKLILKKTLLAFFQKPRQNMLKQNAYSKIIRVY